jgi:hypothetical protein
MKYLILSSLLYSTFAAADVASKLSEFNAFFNEREGNAPICEITEPVRPVIKKGEVKITYPCDSFKKPDQTEKEDITFFDSPEIQSKGIIFRTRVSDEESDVTVKYRPKGAELLVDEEIYKELDDKTKDLKCEADVSYSSTEPKVVESCSLTSDGTKLTDNHAEFLKMVGADDVKRDLSHYKKYQIESTSWKIPSSQFAKGISIEKWEMKKGAKSLCILEVSAKFEVEKKPAASLAERMNAEIRKSLKNLKSSFPGLTPDKVQGNKTGRAIEFLK